MSTELAVWTYFEFKQDCDYLFYFPVEQLAKADATRQPNTTEQTALIGIGIIHRIHGRVQPSASHHATDGKRQGTSGPQKQQRI